MLEFLIRFRRYITITFHIILFIAAYYLAFVLRFETVILRPDMMELFLFTIPILLIVRSVFFRYYGLYKSLWRYTSTFEVNNIIKAVTLSSFLFSFAVFVVFGYNSYPRSVIIIDSITLILLSGGLRLFARMINDCRTQETGKRILIYGAGASGEMLLREIRNNKKLKYKVVGFLDDNLRKKGLNIQGIPILGTKRDMKRLICEKLIEEIIIAVPSASSKQMRAIVSRCKSANISFKTVPSMADLVNGKVSVTNIREIKIDDVLFRQEVKIDNSLHQIKLAGKTVMVTGAAGSIGSELVRQIAKLAPKTLILFDQAESNLFFRDLELKGAFPQIEIVPILGDILNSQKIEKIIAEHRPHVIFHAAAYKHVPMIERNPAEAIRVNITGTKNLAILADKYGVDKFVFISTDKAVNPTSIMGATKRIAELFIKDFSKRSITRFIIVRFGNVLGSDGSIIPIITSQIKKKGPVTITHPEIKRFFMTIPEAVSLVIQAGYLGKGREVFILKMGEQIKIIDLAKTMITLSGYIPFEDIKIIFTGLRPGEKLFEELHYEHESLEETSHKQIQKAIGTDSMDGLELNHYLAQLEEIAEESQINGDFIEIRNTIKKIIPTYELYAEEVSSPTIPAL